jgi:hypothetical protein
MNVFILCTGRCGSTTFIKACRHTKNFTSAHESRRGQLKSDRFRYPTDHIEADNRLSWLLGRLDIHYGDGAYYVHLKRNDSDVAKSYLRRFPTGIIGAYGKKILVGLPEGINTLRVCLDYCDTVNANIAHFLKDKTHRMEFQIENANIDFKRFWNFIGAKGNIEAALSEFEKRYNATPQEGVNSEGGAFNYLDSARKLRRIIKKFPIFIKHA